MFDIGFWELLLIGVIALVVLGPERLPHAVRMTAAFVGKIRRSVIEVRAELERELHADEIRQRIKEEVAKSGINDIKEQAEKLQQESIVSLKDAADKSVSNLGIAELKDELSEELKQAAKAAEAGHGEYEPLPAHDRNGNTQATDTAANPASTDVVTAMESESTPSTPTDTPTPSIRNEQ